MWLNDDDFLDEAPAQDYDNKLNEDELNVYWMRRPNLLSFHAKVPFEVDGIVYTVCGNCTRYIVSSENPFTHPSRTDSASWPIPFTHHDLDRTITE